MQTLTYYLQLWKTSSDQKAFSTVLRLREVQPKQSGLRATLIRPPSFWQPLFTASINLPLPSGYRGSGHNAQNTPAVGTNLQHRVKITVIWRISSSHHRKQGVRYTVRRETSLSWWQKKWFLCLQTVLVCYWANPKLYRGNPQLHVPRILHVQLFLWSD